MTHQSDKYQARYGQDADGHPIIHQYRLVRRLGTEIVPQSERDLIFNFCEKRDKVNSFESLLRRRELQYFKLAEIQNNDQIAARGAAKISSLNEKILQSWLDDMQSPGLFDKGEE